MDADYTFPTAMRQEVLQHLHELHQGVVTTDHLLATTLKISSHHASNVRISFQGVNHLHEA
jgi:hypothetical protein